MGNTNIQFILSTYFMPCNVLKVTGGFSKKVFREKNIHLETMASFLMQTLINILLKGGIR